MYLITKTNHVFIVTNGIQVQAVGKICMRTPAIFLVQGKGQRSKFKFKANRKPEAQPEGEKKKKAISLFIL